MYKRLFQFEAIYFSRQPLVYLGMVLFFFAGFLGGSTSGFTFPNVYKNSPYEIAYLTGILSLAGIFFTTLVIAQSSLRENDTRFDTVLFATPVPKNVYLPVRFISMLLVCVFPLAFATAGIFAGNSFAGLPADKFGEYKLMHYLYPFLVLAFPNILLTTSVITGTAILTKNKLLVYVTGLFIYILYIIGSVFSNSPLIAGSAPVPPEQMALFAKLDPFGMAAFFEQTRYWTAFQRNHELLALSGNFLFNRLLWLAISSLLIAIAYHKFSFSIQKNQGKTKKEKAIKKTKIHFTGIPLIQTSSARYSIQSIFSLVKIYLVTIFKGIPFLLILVIWTCLLLVEFSNTLSGDPRSGQNFARTGLMIYPIMQNLPQFSMIVLLFYSSEVIWKSRTYHFDQIENSTPVPQAVLLFGKLALLTVIPFLLIIYSIVAAIIFQCLQGFPHIEMNLYASLFYYTGYPLVLSAVIIFAIQYILRNKYIGLALAAIFIILFNSRISDIIGMTSPLLRLSNAFSMFYGDMNGFGSYTMLFHFKMIFGTSLCVLLILIISIVKNKTTGIALSKKYLLIFFLLATTASGFYLFYQVNVLHPTRTEKEMFAWKERYERQYKKYENMQLPTINRVQAAVDLYPDEQRYTVQGRYNFVNKTDQPIDSLLVYIPEEITLKTLSIQGAHVIKKDPDLDHYWYLLEHPLAPGDSAAMHFSFSSESLPFKKHTPSNSIIANGTFLRISTFFPVFGYQPENEITNSIEREKRKMPEQSKLKELYAVTPEPYDYAYTDLDLVVSTAADKIAISSGDLIAQWEKNNRNYFHYQADRMIPFRFAISSARYKVKTGRYKNIPIEIYYDERHAMNVGKLITQAKQTLEYCEQAYAPYPHTVIRFAEISSFATGFAGTAYPSVIYMKEDGGFYNDVSDPTTNDVINNLAGHELTHEWWGCAQISPEYKEGGWLLTETIANYTFLMLYRKAYGEAAALEIVKQHLDIYLSSRSFDFEPPLSKTTYTTPHLPYNKGMVVLYQVQQLIGEENVNRALRNVFAAHAYPKSPPSSFDLVSELQKQAPDELKEKIGELFKRVILYDLSIKHVAVTQTSAGYKIAFDAEVHKYEEDGKGRKTEIPMQEQAGVAAVSEKGQSATEYFTPVNNKINGVLFTKEKPFRLIIDPELLLIDQFQWDNEYFLGR